MRFLTAVLTGLAVQGAVASNWFSKAAYNKWHETELEAWLSDHNVPYPTPADRKDLENLVGQNWENYVIKPYNSWSADDLQTWLTGKGVQAQKGAEANKDALVNQVSTSWYETGDQAQAAWGNVKEWIFDTWTDSELKEFADKHGIPVPQPRQRDSVLQKLRAGYETAAQKVNGAVSYPGNWLYETWSESDLKEWLDTHGFPAPQPSSRDKLVASVRRNSRIAYLKAQAQSESASASASKAYSTLTDKIIDAWSESDLKEFADKNGINVPQGTKLNDLRALVRKHRADFLRDNVADKVADTYGAATSSAGNEFSKATNKASLAYQDAFNEAVDTWSESRLKGFLDSRGVPVPQNTKADELRALARKHAHKAENGYSIWTFDDYTVDNLRKYIAQSGDATSKALAEKKDATREDLVNAARSSYATASAAGGDTYASITSYLAQATATAKGNAFDTWSESELKNYLDSYGISVPQGSTVNELRATARKQYTFFKHGTSTPSETIFAKIGDSISGTWNWVTEQVGLGADAAQKKAAEKVKEAEKLAKQDL